MAVYVDDMQAPFGRMKMCHMGAETTAELYQMADAIDVDRKWIQEAGSPYEHFDISLSRRKRAVELGAIEVTQKQFVMRVVRPKAKAVAE